MFLKLIEQFEKVSYKTPYRSVLYFANMDSDEKQSNRIEEMTKRLYSKDQSLLRKNRQGILHKIPYDVPDQWHPDPDGSTNTMAEKMLHKSPIFKKFFIFSLIIFLGAMGFAGYKFFVGFNTVSNDNIDLVILGNSFAAGGEDVPLQIQVVNRNNVALELADLMVEYPNGSTGDETGDYVRLPAISIGTLAPGKSITENVKVVLFGEQGSSKLVKASLEYRVENSNAIFVKESTFPVAINSAPINLAVEGATDVSSNQEFNLTIKATSTSKNPTDDILVKIEYPSGFSFEESTPKPSYGNNVWDLGNMTQGMERDITLKGIIFGQDGEDRAFRIYSGSADTKDKTNIAVTYNSLVQTVLIKKPFLEVGLTVNGENGLDTISDSGEQIQGNILWSNNLPVRVTDAVITATLSGNALDPASVKSLNGFYDSVNNKIIWDKTSVPDLASLEPGQSGGLSFSAKPLSLISGSGVINNPQINISVDIAGKQSDAGGAVSQLSNAEHTTVKISSDLQVGTDVEYYTGPFTNTGPVPPKANTQTTYTVTWSLTNTANQVTQAEAKTILPTYVTFLNKIYPSTENLSYDDSTRTLTWKIGNVLPGTGLVAADRSVSFQVGLTPSTSQVGSIPNLTNETTLLGTDSFTGATLTNSKPVLRDVLNGSQLSGQVIP